MLAAYRPHNDFDAAARLRIEEFVRAHADCFERSLAVGHVTGSAWIVDPSRERCLLTHHRKLGRWLLLGGHCDDDPDVLAVALREAREESGLGALRVLSSHIFDCDVHEIPQRGSEAAHFHHDVRFLLEADPDEPLVVSAESRALAWVALENVAKLSGDESVLRLVAKSGTGNYLLRDRSGTE